MVRDTSTDAVTGLLRDTARVLNAQHRATYDRVAAVYAVRNREMPAAVETAAVQFLEQVGACARVLDLGCGHGRDMAWFEARGIRVVGADLSKAMLAEARRCAKGALVQLDMRLPAFGSASFDGIWCDAAILHLPNCDLPLALREMHRILVPSGVLFVSVQVGAGEEWESCSYDCPAPRFFARHPAQAFGELLVAAGFDIVMQADMPVSPRRHWAHFLALRDESPSDPSPEADMPRFRSANSC